MTPGERAAYMIAAAALRRAAPWSPVPCTQHSRRAERAWELADDSGTVLASVSDAGTVVVHIGGESFGVEVVEGTRAGALVVAATVVMVPETRWHCPACGARWCKAGERLGTYHKCKKCDAGMWLRVAS